MRSLFGLFIIAFLFMVMPVKGLMTITHASEPHDLNLSIMTVNQAIAYAIADNPDLKAFAWNVNLAQENVEIAAAGQRPKVNVTGDVAHIRTDNNLTDDWSGGTSQSLGLNVEQPLYTGGATQAEIRQQRVLEAATRGQFSEQVQRTVVDVVEAYMATFQTLRGMQVNAENVTLLDKQLRATRARFEAGELTRTDTSQAEARLEEAKAALAESRAGYQVAMSGLREIIGDVAIEDLQYPDIDESVLPLTVQQAVAYGIKHNPAIKVAERTIKARDYNVESQRGEFLPQLSANAGLGYDRNPAFSRFERQETATVSLNASMPIYQGGILRSNLRQAKIRRAQAQEEFRAIERAVRNEVVSAWEEYQAVRAQITARQAQLEAARVAYEGVQLEEEVGARSVLDVLDANQELRDAELALIDTKREKVNAYYNLLASLGVLSQTFWDKS